MLPLEIPIPFPIAAYPLLLKLNITGEEAPGIYSVSLIAWNPADRETFYFEDLITVFKHPSQAIDYHKLQGRTIQFFYDTTQVASWVWYFGDGDSSNRKDPIHTYVNDGLYFVTLEVFNICGNFKIIDTINIQMPPLASFTVDHLEGCGPTQVQFINLSSQNASSFEWIFEGGLPNKSSMVEPLVLYRQAGSFSVSLIAKSDVA